MKGALQGSLRLAIFLTLPAMVGLIVFRLPIVHVIFERGAFSRPGTLLTEEVLLAYALGLMFYISNRIVTPAFYAMQDTWTPVKMGMVTVGVNIAASLIFMGPLGAAGLALAQAVSSATNFALLFTCLRRRIGLLGMNRLVIPAAKVALACLPMAAWGVISQVWWNVLMTPGTATKAAILCGEIGVAAGLFLGTAAILRCEEYGWALDLLRRRRTRDIKSGETF
jgi:putative peptidoglycan lipid II flippase